MSRRLPSPGPRSSLDDRRLAPAGERSPRAQVEVDLEHRLPLVGRVPDGDLETARSARLDRATRSPKKTGELGQAVGVFEADEHAPQSDGGRSRPTSSGSGSEPTEQPTTAAWGNRPPPKERIVLTFGALAVLLTAALSVSSAFSPGTHVLLGTAGAITAGLAGYLAFGRILGSGLAPRDVARETALQERRRIARDLHDGLAQELAFIVVQSKWLLARDGETPELAHIATAAERALDESRRVMVSLTHGPDEPLAPLLARVAEDVGARAGLRLELELEEHVVVTSATREALVRIVREAVTNAARHGRASRASISLSNGNGVRLRICDNGAGFDREAVRGAGGFGLTSMEERVREIGGTLRISSRPDEGTEIEVTVP